MILDGILYQSRKHHALYVETLANLADDYPATKATAYLLTHMVHHAKRGRATHIAARNIIDNILTDHPAKDEETANGCYELMLLEYQQTKRKNALDGIEEQAEKIRKDT